MDDREMIQRGLDYIEENLQTEITAAELADMAGFSLYHYYRIFQQTTGMPVMQYILRRRLLHGIYAIAQGSTKTDAAFLYGFDTYPGFYRAFCREFGCPPSEYLRSSRARRPYRIDLMKEEHMIVTHKKASQILRHWGLENEIVTDIYYEGTGNRNDSACYAGENYVLKHTADLGRLMSHFELSKAIRSNGLLSAVPVPALDGREFIQDGTLFFYVSRRLPGRQMTAASLYEKGIALAVGQVIGKLHLALSEVEACVNDGDMLGTLKAWALPRAQHTLGLSDKFCAELLAELEALYPRLSRQIIHRDPNPGNIICAGAQWGILDFDLSERNVRIFDPCYAATAVLSESFGKDNDKWLEIFRDIIQGYNNVAGLTEEEWRAIPYVILANQFICVAWFAEQEKYAEHFEINKRMTRWLVGKFGELKKFCRP